MHIYAAYSHSLPELAHMLILKQTFPLHSDLQLCRYDTAIQQKPLNLLHFPFVQYLDMKAEVPVSPFGI